MNARELLCLCLWPCLVGAAGCPTPPPPAGDGERRAVLARITDQIVRPAVDGFVVDAAALVAATEALEAAGGVAGPAQEDARVAWRAAMSRWQLLEVIHVGPAGPPSAFVGGQGLRDLIYAWPQANPCGVDQQLVQGEFESAGWADGRLVNILGLGAIEYALFVEGPNNACPSAATINTDGSWAALRDAEVLARRAAYARVLAENVHTHAQALDDAWASFGEDLTTAGESGSPFATTQQAIDEVYAALFAIELVTKDLRLGVPSGLNAACTTDTCPEALESRYSATSKENVVANLSMARRVFLGLDEQDRDGAGFDDLLRARDADALADTMTTSIGAALDLARAFEGTFEDSLVLDPTPVRDLYEAVKAFTDDFKSELPSKLGLHVPDEGAGDND